MKFLSCLCLDLTICSAVLTAVLPVNHGPMVWSEIHPLPLRFWVKHSSRMYPDFSKTVASAIFWAAFLSTAPDADACLVTVRETGTTETRGH
eukprot:3638215-Rhodomonas_salina.1